MVQKKFSIDYATMMFLVIFDIAFDKNPST